MKAVGYRQSLPIADPQSLQRYHRRRARARPPRPAGGGQGGLGQPGRHQDAHAGRAKPGEPPKVLGYDAAGVVEAVGPEVSLFKPGDEVFYAGSIVRPGTNAEFHLVDERIVGRKPKSLSFAQAAALPLTSITAWELLFDRFGVAPGKTPDGPRAADRRRRRRRRLDPDPARAPAAPG